MRRRSSGFTLVEVMIVVVVVGILAAIAYPSYLEHVRQTRRAEVTALMLENAQLLERHYTRYGAYDTGTISGLATQAPASGDAVYALALVTGTDSYTITATAESGGVMAGDICASYSLDEVGRRTPSEARCWRR